MESPKPRKSIFHEILPVLLCGLAIPLSIFFWIGNIAFSLVTKNSTHEDDGTAISPTRWLFSILVPVLLAAYGLRRKSVNRSGAILGFIIAVILSLASHAFLAILATFFLSSSRITRFREQQKRKFDADFKGGEGKRNWVQALCNGGMAMQLALLYLLDCGSSERPIDFSSQYRSSWLGIAILSSIACCNGDTWASEIGTVVGTSEPFLITTRKRVPRGTNGGVSIVGLIVSFIGGAIIGVAYFLTIWYTTERNVLFVSPPQWPIILFAGVAGFIGSIIDSLIGATFQYSGIDNKGKVVERPGPDVKYISGVGIFDNHSVNLIASILTALIMPFIAFKCWPQS